MAASADAAFSESAQMSLELKGDTMKQILDARSFVIGLLVTSLVVVASGAMQIRPGESVGRFQLVASETTDEIFVVDTVTGQVWQELENGNISSRFYQPKLIKLSR